jgi:hypothetical protein
VPVSFDIDDGSGSGIKSVAPTHCQCHQNVPSSLGIDDDCRVRHEGGTLTRLPMSSECAPRSVGIDE